MNQQTTEENIETFPISLFSSITTTTPTARNLEHGELLHLLKSTAIVPTKELRQRCYSFNTYKEGTTRGTDGVLAMTACVLDFDNKTPRPGHIEEMQIYLKHYCNFWHTTYSHTEEQPRWRVILPFEKPIDAARWPALFDRVHYFFEDDPSLDKVGAKVAQIYFFPYVKEIATYKYGAVLDKLYFNPLELPEREVTMPVVVYHDNPPTDPPRPQLKLVVPEERITNALNAISPDLPYEQWIAIGMALKDELGDNAFHLWNTWSCPSPKYPGERHLYTHWKSFKRNGKTIATLFALAKEHGYKEQPPQITVAPEEDIWTEEDTDDYILHNWGEYGAWDLMDFGKFPLIAQIYQNYKDHMPQDREKLSLGAAIAVAGFLFEQHYCLRASARTNFYTMNLATPGYGKDRLINITKELIVRVKLDKYYSRDIETPAALSGIIVDNRGTLFYCVDEIGESFAAMRHKNAASYKQGIFKTLKEVFSCGPHAKSRTRADMKSNTPIEKVEKTFVASSFFGTGALFSHVTLDDFTSGLLSRYVVFYDDDSSKYDLNYGNGDHESYTKPIYALTIPPKDLLPAEKAPIEVEDGVYQWLDAFSKFGKEKGKLLQEKTYIEQVFHRFKEQISKIATLTVIKNGDKGLLTLDGYKWATRVVLESLFDTVKIVDTYYNQDRYTKDRQRILDAIKRIVIKKKRKTITVRDVLRTITIRKKIADEILEQLESEGMVSLASQPSPKGLPTRLITYLPPIHKGTKK